MWSSASSQLTCLRDTGVRSLRNEINWPLLYSMKHGQIDVKMRLELTMSLVAYLILLSWSCLLNQINANDNDKLKSASSNRMKLCGIEIYAMHEFCCKNGCVVTEKKEAGYVGGLEIIFRNCLKLLSIFTIIVGIISSTEHSFNLHILHNLELENWCLFCLLFPRVSRCKYWIKCLHEILRPSNWIKQIQISW